MVSRWRGVKDEHDPQLQLQPQTSSSPVDAAGESLVQPSLASTAAGGRGRFVRLRRGVLALAAAVVAGSLVVALPPAETQADWVDSDSARASFEALTVPAPQGGANPQCRAANVVLLGSQLTVRWKVPAGSGYTLEDAQFTKEVNGLLDPITGPLLSSITTTGTPDNYTTVVSGGLLSNTLGGSIVFGIRLVDESGWASDWLATHASFPALIGVNTCTFDIVSPTD
ncbi:MAG: hypothetical protein GX862_04765 [Leucobacter sp.]|nr:hypothetical protein [Leucobacter sp.]